MPNEIEENPISFTEKQIQKIKSGAAVLFAPKQLVEVRARGVDGYWHGFYFTNHDYMAKVVQKLDTDPRIQSIYYIFNKINPKLIEQRKKCPCDKCVRSLIVVNPEADQVENIITGPSQHLTTDEDIETLNWMFIDVDTTRASGFEHEPSTKAEKDAAKKVADNVIAYLNSKDWPNAVLADSGNGYHILPRLNQPNTDTNTGLLLDALKVLAFKFSNATAEIDTSVCNAARLTRAYGTHTRKGTNTKDRPYRINRIVDPKGPILAVPFDKILNLGTEGPKTSRASKNMPVLHATFDPQKFFDHYEKLDAFSIEGTKPWQDKSIEVVDRCIISGTKHTGSSLTGFVIGDTFGYHCWSPECDDPGIADVLRKLAERGYAPYPDPIWVEEPILLNFDKNPNLDDENGKQYEPPEGAETKSVLTMLDAKIAQEAVEEGLPAPLVINNKPIQIGDIEPNQYAEWLMGVILHDPKKIGIDFGFYRKRFEKIAKHLTDIVREVFGSLLLYERNFRRLPTKIELLDYIRHDEACADHPLKNEMITLTDAIKYDESKTFDVMAKRLLWEMDWRLESAVVKKAYDGILRKNKDIQAFRTALRKHWATTIGLDSDFKPGTWQENTESIYEAFRRDISGEGDSRKFKLGFESIDNSGMSIGLDGNHAIVIYGPAGNRKTNAAMTIALNFAMQGKRGLFLAGEHLRVKIEKRLTLMLSYYLRKSDDNPDGIDIIPGLQEWEGINRTANEHDLENVGRVLAELKAMNLVPGYLEVQNIGSLIAGEDDAAGSVMAYIDATDKKYQWDFVIIDPLEDVLPPDKGDKGHFNACAAIVDRLFKYSRSFRGDQGLMIVATAQFKADVRREIEKIQAKNVGIEDYDDEIVSILRRDSGIQYIGNKLTQKFDLAIGVALRTYKGEEGMLVQGRSREGGSFDVMPFHIDKHANLMLEARGGATHKTNTDAEPQGEMVMRNYDEL